ncbi:hypothetical protein KR018_011305 [Drosophila ironensis]|nr:hypothetical protein KR018_011305 [Drosophila ironensis]
MLQRVCCMRLNTYGVVVGWLGLIFSFLAVILLATGLGFATEIAQKIAQDINDPNASAEDIRAIVVVVLGVYLALKVINLLASAMLIFGTVKERHLLLLPWLINNGVLLVFAFIGHITLWVTMVDSKEPISSAVPMVLFSLAILALLWYLYYGIYSLFKHIQASSEQQRPLIPQPAQQGNSYPSYTKI